uniref:Protein FAM229A n=1 Tax=Callorhinchus milii TaxID=7868 RepID=A0A4W3JQM6_CALMI|eukprot:gi/632972100/ref/XP_007902494.1/ PREDICTED: protein FAM229A [Callorhinchus milii]
MSSTADPEPRRFPIEAGDSKGSVSRPVVNSEPEIPNQRPARQLRRCPGSHCLTIPHVSIDVYIAMDRNPPAHAT